MCPETQALCPPYTSISIEPLPFYMYVDRAFKDTCMCASVHPRSLITDNYPTSGKYTTHSDPNLKPTLSLASTVQKHERAMVTVSPAPFRPHVWRRHRTLLCLHHPKAKLQPHPANQVPPTQASLVKYTLMQACQAYAGAFQP